MTDFAVLDSLDGLITTDIGHTLHNLAQRVPAGQAIVEIGSYRGKSTAYLAAGAADGVPVYAVDPWEQRPLREWHHNRGRNIIKQPTLAAFTAQLQRVGLARRVTPMQGLSVDIARAYTGPPVGLLFIDGDHRADACQADFHSWRPHFAPGATVAFDDYDEQRNPGVVEAVGQLKPMFNGTPVISGRLLVTRVP